MPIAPSFAFIAATVILMAIPRPNVMPPQAIRISMSIWSTTDAIVDAWRSNH